MSNSSSQDRINEKLSSPNGDKGKRNIIVGISVGVMVIILIAILILLLFKSNAPVTSNQVVTPENVEEIIASEKKVDQGTYEVKMNSTWMFENGSSASSNAYVENATSNTNNVYFDVVRSDNGETIFTSPVIPIGSHLEDITLDKALSAGTYDCVLTYHLLDDGGETLSTLQLKLIINVEN